MYLEIQLSIALPIYVKFNSRKTYSARAELFIERSHLEVESLMNPENKM